VAALRALADEGKLPQSRAKEAMEKYSINPDAPHALKK
jgi:pyruvate dehydrogenase complex dehydrogenase (E1) component